MFNLHRGLRAAVRCERLNRRCWRRQAPADTPAAQTWLRVSAHLGDTEVSTMSGVIVGDETCVVARASAPDAAT